MKRTLGLASAILLLLCFSPAFSHTVNFSDSELSLSGSQAIWNFRVHLGDFDARFGRAEEAAVKNYISEKLGVAVGGSPCDLKRLDLAQDAGLELETLHLVYACPSSHPPIQLRYDLFYGDPNHRHLLKLNAFGKTFSDTFSPGRTEASFAIGGVGETVRNFLKLGLEHILTGYDHILFLLTLIFGAKRLKDLFWLVTSFTLAHSISLALSVLGIVTLSPKIVEPLIAASIVYVAIQDLLSSGQRTPRDLFFLTFGFGLIHGLGFSYALREANLSSGNLALPLVCFNFGVEMGQLLVVGLAYPLLLGLSRAIRNSYPLYFKRTALLLIAGTGLFWMLQRIL